MDGINKIKEEVTSTNSLNKAYIPILQGISPGELQAAENAKNFAIRLVKEWLLKYKFKNWDTHSSNNQPVTLEEKKQRAKEIANALSDHNQWLTHARSLRIKDLKKLRLKIEDYSENNDLNDAVTRYFVLLEMTFQTNIYKIFETKDSQIYRFINQNVPPLKQSDKADGFVIDVTCKTCHTLNKIEGKFGKSKKIQVGHIPFPKNNKFKCSGCGIEIDIANIRQKVEAQTKRVIF